jgi:CheY-like chemotaxis protein
MGARILIIEDNRENLELMTYLLSAFGHTCGGPRKSNEAKHGGSDR